MGKTLSAPILSKHLQRTGDPHFKTATAWTQGKRIHFEDRVHVSFFESEHIKAFFGVFDGFDGTAAADYLKENLCRRLCDLNSLTDENIQQALVDLDQQFLTDQSLESETKSGSTAAFVMITDLSEEEKTTIPLGGYSSPRAVKKLKYQLTVGNIGDSRVIIGRANGTFEAVSTDHTPKIPSEKIRMEKYGGVGDLHMSRFFGASGLKDTEADSYLEQKVIAVPEMTNTICEEGDYILLASDGLYATLHREQVHGIVSTALRPHYKNADPGKIVCELLDKAIEKGSADNITATLVLLTHNNHVENTQSFIPGPLIHSYSYSGTFLDAYLRDAKLGGMDDGPLLRFLAYYEALRHVRNTNPSVYLTATIKSALASLQPCNMLITDLAQVLAAKNHQTGLTQDDLQILASACDRDVGDTNLRDLKKLFQSHKRFNELTLSHSSRLCSSYQKKVDVANVVNEIVELTDAYEWHRWDARAYLSDFLCDVKSVDGLFGDPVAQIEQCQNLQISKEDFASMSEYDVKCRWKEEGMQKLVLKAVKMVKSELGFVFAKGRNVEHGAKRIRLEQKVDEMEQ